MDILYEVYRTHLRFRTESTNAQERDELGFSRKATRTRMRTEATVIAGALTVSSVLPYRRKMRPELSMTVVVAASVVVMIKHQE